MSEPITVHDLTDRQRLVLLVFDGDPVHENRIVDECWPQVRSARQVVNALQRAGLVRLVQWEDEEHGYEVTLTETGQRLRDLLAPPEVSCEDLCATRCHGPCQGLPLLRQGAVS